MRKKTTKKAPAKKKATKKPSTKKGGAIRLTELEVAVLRAAHEKKLRLETELRMQKVEIQATLAKVARAHSIHDSAAYRFDIDNGIATPREIPDSS